MTAQQWNCNEARGCSCPKVHTPSHTLCQKPETASDLHQCLPEGWRPVGRPGLCSDTQGRQWMMNTIPSCQEACRHSQKTQVSLTLSAECFSPVPPPSRRISSPPLIYSFGLLLIGSSSSSFPFLSFNFLTLPLSLFLQFQTSSSSSSLGQYYRRSFPQLALSVGKKDEDKWQNLEQCFSTFVRPRPGKFFFIRRRPGPNIFTRKYLSIFFKVHTLN